MEQPVSTMSRTAAALSIGSDPPAPMYGYVHFLNSLTLAAKGRAVRGRLHPPNQPPPHGGMDGALAGIATSELSVSKLLGLVCKAWLDPYPPSSSGRYSLEMAELQKYLKETATRPRRLLPRIDTSRRADVEDGERLAVDVDDVVDATPTVASSKGPGLNRVAENGKRTRIDLDDLNVTPIRASNTEQKTAVGLDDVGHTPIPAFNAEQSLD
ncbi:hypothetical protein HJFPF1_00522 [Paramyrothecium foliicola]|nr:hypothetical protein HJFPF1_00522 [Paramyrothecium foliicola]